MSCYYCKEHSNPFKYGYAELVFAWRPVSTPDGLVWLKKVHRRQSAAPSSSMFGVPRLEIWHEYFKHIDNIAKEIKGEQQ